MTNALLDRAIAAGTCDFLRTSGSSAMAYAAWGLLTPGPFDEFGAIAYSGVAQLAYAAGCNWDPDQEGQTGGNTFGCVKKAPGTSNAIVRSPCEISPGDSNYLSTCAIYLDGFSEIVSVREFTNANGPTVSRYEIDAINSAGEFVTLDKNVAGIEILLLAGTKFGLYGDGECESNGDEKPDDYTYDYTDPETGCSLKVEMLGYAVDGANRVSPAWQITAGSDGARANGGVITGDCNFAPTVVVPPFGGPPGGGDGDPPTYLPNPEGDDPDDGDEPWWMRSLRFVVPHAIAGATQELLRELLNKKYPSVNYQLESVCELNEAGEPVKKKKTVEIPAEKAPTAQIARLDAIVELLQAHKDFKQPICNDKPKLEGDWVTLRFESDEPSPNSNRVIRKLLRYRSKSGAGLGAITDYWRGFTWTTGQVIVAHKGAWWGTPKVWAVSANEGKRVLRHVAREAGIDPDQVGEWVISGSRDPRYGVSLPVKFAQLDGGPWVTQRDSPSGPPLINR